MLGRERSYHDRHACTNLNVGRSLATATAYVLIIQYFSHYLLEKNA
jgi:hypothetical protein